MNFPIRTSILALGKGWRIGRKESCNWTKNWSGSIRNGRCNTYPFKPHKKYFSNAWGNQWFLKYTPELLVK